MPAIWGLKPLTESIEEDKAIRLSSGAVLDISGDKVKLGEKPTQETIDAIIAKVQASMDVIEAQTNLSKDDPERTWLAGDFTAVYGGRRFLDGSGNIVDRPTRFSLIWRDGRLVPSYTHVT